MYYSVQYHTGTLPPNFGKLKKRSCRYEMLLMSMNHGICKHHEHRTSAVQYCSGIMQAKASCRGQPNINFLDSEEKLKLLFKPLAMIQNEHHL